MTARILRLNDRQNLDVQLAQGLATGMVGYIRAFIERAHPKDPLASVNAALAAAVRALDLDDLPGAKLALIAALAQDFTEADVTAAIAAFRENEP